MTRRLLLATIALGLIVGACSASAEDGVSVASTASALSKPAVPDHHVDDRVCLSDAPDETRCWLELDASDGDAAPLLIDLHGAGQPAARLRKYSGMERVAVREGLVVVWPDSPDLSWNDGSCCGPAQAADRDDVAFIAELIEHVSSRLPIDARRVYLTGYSNGCGLAQRVAVRRSDLIAAVACYSDYLFDEPAAAYEPVPVLQVHGTADNAVPYGPAGANSGAVENAATWARFNDCASPPDITRIDLFVEYRYVGCRDGADVVHVAIVGGEHVPTPEIEIHEVLWGFLDRYQRSPPQSPIATHPQLLRHGASTQQGEGS